MRTVTMKMRVDGMTADELFERVGSFEDYPEHTDAVRDVGIDDERRDRSTSSWEINFRDGVMRWREEDRFLPDERRIEFEALDGDLERFSGWWLVEPSDGAAALTFHAEFDLGLATLNEMVEPIADEALRESIERIVDGVTGGCATVLEGGAAANV